MLFCLSTGAYDDNLVSFFKSGALTLLTRNNVVNVAVMFYLFNSVEVTLQQCCGCVES